MRRATKLTRAIVVALFAARLIEDGRRWMVHIPSRGLCRNMKWGCCRQCGLGACKFPRYSFAALEAEMELYKRKRRRPKIVKLGTFGSWPEVPWRGRMLVYGYMRRLHVVEVQIETRPELVTPAFLEELREQLPGIKVVIEVGLDHADAWARNYVLERGNLMEDYRMAMRRIARYEKFGIVAATFVAAGLPIGWSERQSADGAIRTIREAIRAGAKMIWLEPVVLQPGTIQQYLLDHWQWEPIWLWTIREVILAVWSELQANGVQLKVGGPTHWPIPNGMPTNRCPKCDGRFLGAIRAAERGDVALLKQIKCSCQKHWRERLDHCYVSDRREIAKIRRLFDEERYRHTDMAA